MKLLEKMMLSYRANLYKKKHDKGGIAYIIASVNKGQTVLDIGAHKAGYLYFFVKQVGVEGKIFAFEPQTNLYQYIKKIKELFRWDNVTIEHLAISDSNGSTKLFIPKNNDTKSSSPGATIVEHKWSSDYSTTEIVSTETLDSYCNRLNITPTFLKIDVEGNELRIFAGGIETIKKCKPKILVEIEARHVGQEKVLATFKFLEQLGYKGHMLYGLNHIPLAEFSFEKFQNMNDMSHYCNNFIFE
jgi:FkbM family methyltransferase